MDQQQQFKYQHAGSIIFIFYKLPILDIKSRLFYIINQTYSDKFIYILTKSKYHQLESFISASNYILTRHTMYFNLTSSIVNSVYSKDTRDSKFEAIQLSHQNYRRTSNLLSGMEQAQLYQCYSTNQPINYYHGELKAQNVRMDEQSWMINRDNHQFEYVPNLSQFSIRKREPLYQNYYGGPPQNGNYFMNDNNFNQRYSFEIPELQFQKRQYLTQIPALNSPDSYVHYLFLKSISQDQTIVINSQLKCYLLQFLAQQYCPYPYSALSFLLQRTENLSTLFAKHQLCYLVKILETKYPYDIDYSQQHKKIQSYDNTQSQKFINLLGLLAQFWRRVGREDLYAQFLLNYLLVSSVQFQQTLKNQRCHREQSLIERQFEQGLKQLIELGINFQPNKSLKFTKILYNLIPSQQIMKENENRQILLLQISSICLKSFSKKNHIQNVTELFITLQKLFIEELSKISNKIRNIQGILQDCQQLKVAFEQFSFRVLNLISLGIWNRYQILQYIKLINSCQFLCGLNREQLRAQYDNIIQYALEISHRKQKSKANINNWQKNDGKKFQNFQLQDEW